ncbi:LuxR C-terminal-related transcriptional regulator [Paramicrobacterium chengjingii]|uniref:LuxR C-terminal-related transcriptional regulator n=1 Tax=Paramicrobacterium chengjingii TaxID=2769067 RepID=UPI001422B726|nr:LuxR C-terminal-related transcriptional regulator [Microbacterium chengjingii]
MVIDFRIPRIARWRLHREDLLRRLDRLAPLTELVGADGAGKTMLLADWSRRRKLSGALILWNSGESLDTVGLLKRVTELTAPEASADEIIVVLDDADRADSDAVCDLVARLVMLDELYVVVTSRTRMELGDLGELGRNVILGRELVVNEAESGDLGQIYGADVARARALRLAVGGWIGPLSAALASGVSAHGFDASDVDGRVLRAVREAMGEPDFDTLSEIVKLEGHDSTGWPMSLKRRLVGLGFAKGDIVPSRNVRLIPVLDALLTTGGATEATALQRALRRVQSCDLTATWTEKMRLLSANEEWTELGSLWSGCFVDAFANEPEAVSEIIDALPLVALDKNASLRAARRFLSVTTRAGFSAADYSELERQDGEGGSLASLSSSIVHAMEHGNYAIAERSALRLRQELSNLKVALGPRTATHYRYVLGSALLYRADPTVTAGLVELDYAYDNAQLSGDVKQASMIATGFALTFCFLGSLTDARKWFERVLDSRAGCLEGRLLEAFFMVERGDTAGASREIAEIYEQSQDDVRYWAFAAWIHSRVKLASHETAAALSSVRHAAELHAQHMPSSRLNTALIERSLADIAVASGKRAMVQNLVRNSDAPHILAVPKARSELVYGDYEAALDTALAWVWSDHILPGDRVELAVISAEARLLLGRRADADASLLQSIELARGTGNYAPLGHLSTDARYTFENSGVWPVGSEINAVPQWDWYPRQTDVSFLSGRERVVLAELAQGQSNAEIARALTVSVNTVKKQLVSAYAKLGVTSRVEAVHRARSLGIVHSTATETVK